MRKNLSKTIAALSVSLLCGSVYAQSVPTGKDNPAKFPNGVSSSGSSYSGPSYNGLSYPEPQISAKKEKDIPTLNELMSGSVTERAKEKDEVSSIRKSALVEIATAMGASAGAASRMQELKVEVNKKSHELDKIFNFKEMRLADGVMLPVVMQSKANYNKNSDDEIMISDKRFIIDTPSKFVSVYPTWRSYLFLSLPTFDAPPSSVLPKNDTERAIWDNAVKEGWKRGVEQANRIFEASYARLEKDYLGMDLARILMELKLLTPTVLAKQNLGVTGGGREMDINSQVFRITDHSALNPNSGTWGTEYPITINNDGKYE